MISSADGTSASVTSRAPLFMKWSSAQEFWTGCAHVHRFLDVERATSFLPHKGRQREDHPSLEILFPGRGREKVRDEREIEAEAQPARNGHGRRWDSSLVVRAEQTAQRGAD